MHQPRPYGLHTIGLPLTSNDESFIASITQRITNLKEVSGVDSIKMVYDLPDGGYVIVQDMGGNFRVIAHKPKPVNDPIYDGLASTFIPMLYSGVIIRAGVFDNEGVDIRLTESARNRLRQYDNEKTKPSKDLSLFKFRIKYSYRYQEFIPKKQGAILYTQYSQLRPTWYSGAMAEVMQIVGGYGRLDASDLPDNDWERTRVMIPNDLIEEIESEISGVRLPGYTGKPNINGQFQYDYKFNNTNAVGFDELGKPWLLKIASNGVWAMPMPIVPATKTRAFRKYIEEMQDDEILDILNRFGGMPSGESFPEASGFEAWRKAGVIIKICDSSDFYSHIAYSSACGWSLNSKGSEGYNTCYDYDDETGLGYGLTYKLRLSLASSKHYDGLPIVRIPLTDERAAKIEAYIRLLLPIISDGSSESRAILFKLRLATLEEIYARAILDKDDDVDYWRNLEVDPIADHIGSLTEVYRGYLYHSAKFEYQPQIKFPEPLVGGCLSHDFLPLIEGRYGKKPNSDTIMFAYYVGDQLKTIKYFIDWGTFQRSEVSNFESFMTVGSWERIQYNGLTGVQGCFYSSDIDDRELISPTVITTNIDGEDRGYDTRPKFAYDSPSSKSGTIWRHRYHTQKINTVTEVGKNIDLSVCIPYFFRNAALHAKKDRTTSTFTTESFGLKKVLDPTSYTYWTYDFVFAWSYMGIKNPKGNPYPKDGSPVWVEEEFYRPYNGSDFADNGSWLPGLPYDYTHVIHPNKNEWVNASDGVGPKADPYNNSTLPESVIKGSLKISIMGDVITLEKTVPRAGYFLSSPNETGDIFYQDACSIVFGAASYSSSFDPSKSSSRIFWGNSRLPDNKSAHHFIGVINE